MKHTPRKRSTKRARAARRIRPDSLTAKQRLFILEFLANGWNATRAYLAAYPNCSSYAAASAHGHRLVRSGKVRAALADAQSDRFTELEMKAAEAIARISLIARADIVDAFDPETGNLLPVARWPDSIRLAVKAVRPDGTVVLYDALRACETMAIVAGRLKPTLNVLHKFDHAAYLADQTPSEPR